MQELWQNPNLVLWVVLENLFVISVIGWCFVWQNRKNQNKKQDYDILEMMNQYYEQDLEARQLLDSQIERIDKLYQIVNTDNHLVNAILNQKLSEAKEKGIEVRCVILTTFAGIENKDICNLFGNLLDNAIEANKKRAGAWLELISEGDEKELELICRNSTEKELKIKNNELPVTRKDRSFHGYGVRIIRETVERYHGRVTYLSGDGEIEAVVTLKRRADKDGLSI